MSNSDNSSQHNEPLISVIVPVFQVEKYLNKCISSIISQTYHNLEIILIDDGSTDDSPIICDRFQETDTRIKVIHQKNGGLSHARNIGLRISTGNFISFVDSDDWIEPKMYEILMSVIQETGADIAVCNCLKESEGAEAIQIKLVTKKIKSYTSEIAIKKLITGKSFINISVWNKLYKKSIIPDINFPEGKICEDIQWTPQAISNAKIIACIDYPLYHYIYRNNSLSHDSRLLSKRLDDRIKLYKKLNEFINIHYPHLKKNNLNIQDLYCLEYINISLYDNQIDVNGKIRNDLHNKFRQSGFKNIIDIYNLKMTIGRILFWYCPKLFINTYLLYKNIKS